MKVRYKIYDSDAYNSACSAIDDLYPNDSLPDPEQFTERGTGEIVSFIKGGFFSKDQFLIADDETRQFKKVNVSDCEMV